MNPAELCPIRRPSVAVISPDLIHFGDRRREEYGDLNSLAHSLKERGIISPLAVKLTPDAEKPYLLLAGGRRFRAIEIAGITEIPVRVYEEDLSELEIRSIELAENFHRKNLEWLEEVKLKKEIHSLQQEIHGVPMNGQRIAGCGWSLQDTADLLNRSKASIISDMRIADAAEKLPELFKKCKSKSDASKVVQKIEHTMLLGELSKRVQIERKNDDSFKKFSDAYMVRDFFEGAAELPSGIFNLVELDPDFAIDVKDNFRHFGSDHEQAYTEVSRTDFPVFFQRVVKELNRLTAEHAWIICWHAYEWTGFVMDTFRQQGFHVSMTPGYWIKPNHNGQSNAPQYNLFGGVEPFMVVRKGSPTLAKPGRLNEFVYNPLKSAEKIHPFERPLDLMMEILSTFTFLGSRVLVPFLGSGKTILAAHRLGMTAVGFDLSSQYKDSFLVKAAKGDWK
jgi:ParB/RepB/Spo0J family partition protein